MRVSLDFFISLTSIPEERTLLMAEEQGISRISTTELSAVSLDIEIEIDESVDEVLVDPELKLTANSSSSLIEGEGQISAGVFSTICGITSPLITG